MAKVLVIGDIYKNKKTGNLYRIVDFAINATNAQDGQRMVCYAPANSDDYLYVREINEFEKKFVLG